MPAARIVSVNIDISSARAIRDNENRKNNKKTKNNGVWTKRDDAATIMTILIEIQYSENTYQRRYNDRIKCIE